MKEQHGCLPDDLVLDVSQAEVTVPRIARAPQGRAVYSESCRVLGRALTRLMPGAGAPGVVRFRRIGLPGPGLLLVDVPGCARHCAPPVWRARCLTTAQDVVAGVHRLRSAHLRPSEPMGIVI